MRFCILIALVPCALLAQTAPADGNAFQKLPPGSSGSSRAATPRKARGMGAGSDRTHRRGAAACSPWRPSGARFRCCARLCPRA